MTLRVSQTSSTLFDALRGASVAPFSSKIQASLSQSVLFLIHYLWLTQKLGQ